MSIPKPTAKQREFRGVHIFSHPNGEVDGAYEISYATMKGAQFVEGDFRPTQAMRLTKALYEVHFLYPREVLVAKNLDANGGFIAANSKATLTSWLEMNKWW